MRECFRNMVLALLFCLLLGFGRTEAATSNLIRSVRSLADSGEPAAIPVLESLLDATKITGKETLRLRNELKQAVKALRSKKKLDARKSLAKKEQRRKYGLAYAINQIRVKIDPNTRAPALPWRPKDAAKIMHRKAQEAFEKFQALQKKENERPK